MLSADVESQTTKDLVLLPHVAHMIDTLPTLFHENKNKKMNMPHLIIYCCSLFPFLCKTACTQHQRGINSLYVRVSFQQQTFWLTFIVFKQKTTKIRWAKKFAAWPPDKWRVAILFFSRFHWLEATLYIHWMLARLNDIRVCTCLAFSYMKFSFNQFANVHFKSLARAPIIPTRFR